MISKVFTVLGAVLISVTFALPSFAASETVPTMPKCEKGFVWSESAKKCVEKTSSIVPDEAITDQAWLWAYAGDHEYAIELFSEVAVKGSASALNGLGYSHRMLGQTERAIGYYEQALAIDPDYILARNYLAKGYLALGQMEPALKQMSEIGKRCKAPCKLYHDLKSAIILADNGATITY